jgi:hypothetical protein
VPRQLNYSTIDLIIEITNLIENIQQFLNLFL